MTLLLSKYLRLDYTWVDQSRKAVKLPAPTYIDYVMTWLQNMLDDDSVFPTKAGKFTSAFAVSYFDYCSQVAIFQRRLPPLQNTFTVSSFECLPIYTMHTIPHSCTFLPKAISTRSLRISSRLGNNTTC